MADEPLMLPDYELKRIMATVPAESFVVAVVLRTTTATTWCVPFRAK